MTIFEHKHLGEFNYRLPEIYCQGCDKRILKIGQHLAKLKSMKPHQLASGATSIISYRIYENLISNPCGWRGEAPDPAQKFMSICRGGPRPRRWVAEECGVINNVGGNRSSMITVTVQLNQQRWS